MEKDKKYNVILGLMIFFFIIIIGVGIAWGLGYIGLNKNSISEDNVGYESDNRTIENNQVKVEEQASNKVNNQTNIANNTVKNTITKVSLLQLDSSKCLNKPTAGSEYKYMIDDCYGVWVSYYDNKLYIGISEFGELAKSTSDINVEFGKSYEIKNIDVSKVSDVIIKGWGQGVDCPIVFFLMKDGTVEWLNSYQALVNKKFEAEGKITGVENVERIIRASVGGDDGPGNYTIIGIRADGTFYDLYQSINK